MKRFDSYFSSVCQLLKDIWMVVYAWMHNNANELISLSEIRALAWLSALALLYVCWKWHNSFHLCRCDIHANYCQFWHRIRYACLIFGAWWRGDGEWKNDMIRIALKIQSFMCLNKVGSANMMQAQINANTMANEMSVFTVHVHFTRARILFRRIVNRFRWKHHRFERSKTEKELSSGCCCLFLSSFFCHCKSMATDRVIQFFSISKSFICLHHFSFVWYSQRKSTFSCVLSARFETWHNHQLIWNSS